MSGAFTCFETLQCSIMPSPAMMPSLMANQDNDNLTMQTGKAMQLAAGWSYSRVARSTTSEEDQEHAGKCPKDSLSRAAVAWALMPWNPAQ